MSQDFFIPRTRTFWLYHGSAMAAGQAITVMMILRSAPMAGAQIASSLVWIVYFTFTMLAFRWLYKYYAGARWPMGRLIAAVIVYSGVAAMAIATALQWTVWPWYWADIRLQYPGRMSEILKGRVIDDFISSQLLVAVWAFIYVSVTAVRRVRQAEVSNLKLENALKDAQLSSLANQLNPHFLFNALNNIRFMMYEDVRGADGMITSLSEMLRYSLDSSRHEKVGLDQELAVIGKYIALVATQLEERLDFHMQIGPELTGAQVPPMVLQMLVENAIKHGVEPLPQGGSLTLAVQGKDGRLLIEVGNDAPLHASPAAAGMGIGLRNIGQRLQLLYGELASLDVDSSPGRFTARLNLPMEHA